MSFYSKHILPKYLDATMQGVSKDIQRKEVVSQASGTVLEIGFGSGLNLPFYKNISKLYAVDPSVELYELAKERLQKTNFTVEYLPVSAEEIPLPDNTIDFVISTWNLCSIPHPEKALKEIFRILKPEGKFLFIEHGKSDNKILSSMQTLMTPISKKIAGGCHWDRDMEKLIKDAGFVFEKLEKFTMKGKPLGRMYKGVGVKK